MNRIPDIRALHSGKPYDSLDKAEVKDFLTGEFKGSFLFQLDLLTAHGQWTEVGRVTPCAPSLAANENGAHRVMRPTQEFMERVSRFNARNGA